MKTELAMIDLRIVRLTIALCSILAVACAAPSQYQGVYRSDDYVIYKIKALETPADLAQRFLGSSDLDWMIAEANNTLAFKPGQYAIIPTKYKNIGGISPNGVQQVPILCYHRFGKYCDSPLCVPEAVFEQQMKYLKENGFRVITPDQMVAFLEYRQPLPKKSVMITVDDGYQSFYTVAYPILKKYGFSATLFVYVNYVGISSKALSWDQLRELQAEGFVIGSHTIMHSDLSKQGEKESDQAYLTRLHYEIFESKKIIDAKLNQNTVYFAYPFGRSNEAAMELARQAGYKLAMTVVRGGNPFFTNAYSLQRDQVLKRDMPTFVSRLQTFQPLPLR